MRTRRSYAAADPRESAPRSGLRSPGRRYVARSDDLSRRVSHDELRRAFELLVGQLDDEAAFEQLERAVLPVGESNLGRCSILTGISIEQAAAGGAAAATPTQGAAAA